MAFSEGAWCSHCSCNVKSGESIFRATGCMQLSLVVEATIVPVVSSLGRASSELLGACNSLLL